MYEPNIYLRPITKNNWKEAALLKLLPDQDSFVASNLFSIAQSGFEKERVILAIYNDTNQMVGFAMYNNKPLEDGTYRISRFMIDKDHQHKGYGRVAIGKILGLFAEIPGCKEIVIEISKENNVVMTLFKDYGFQYFGENEKNILAKFQLRRDSPDVSK